MAITSENLTCSIGIKVEADVAADGSTIYKERTISRIDPAASDENCYDVAAAIGTLQSCPVGDITRTTKVILSRA